MGSLDPPGADRGSRHRIAAIAVSWRAVPSQRASGQQDPHPSSWPAGRGCSLYRSSSSSARFRPARQGRGM